MATMNEWRAGWVARREAERREAELRCRTGRARAARLARRLADAFGADRVLLIGSIARGDGGVDSDIDLVVSGIAPERFYAAAGHVDRESGEFDVDLIPWETATPSLRATAEREGIVLYERRSAAS